MLRNPFGSAGEVTGGGGGRGVVVVGAAVGGGDGGKVANWLLGGSSNRTNFDVSVVVAGSKVGKFENPLKEGFAGCAETKSNMNSLFLINAV